MKQRISVENLLELNHEQQEKLREWWKPEIGDKFDYREQGIVWLAERVNGDSLASYAGIFMKCDCLPLLSIGQMLQLIDEHGYINYHFIVGRSRNSRPTSEFCDMLWGDIKAIL